MVENLFGAQFISKITLHLTNVNLSSSILARFSLAGFELISSLTLT